MKYNILDKKANIVLDEMSEGYKEILIMQLYEECGDMDPRNININDLVRLDSRNKEPLLQGKRNRQLKKASQAISLLGNIYTLLGFIIMMYAGYRNQDFFTVGILVSFLGLFATIFSFVYVSLMQLRNEKSKNKRSREYDVIFKWNELERALEKYSRSQQRLSGESISYSLHKTIYDLQEENVIDEEELSILERLRTIRNYVVHEGRFYNSKFSSKDLDLLLDRVDLILNKIKYKRYEM